MNRKHYANYLSGISFSFVFVFFPFFLHAQGIKGKVSDIYGNPLSFASIGVTSTSQGTAANIEGQYQLNLSPGKYTLRVIYLGYAHLDTIINVGTGWIQYNPKLRPEAVALPEAVVTNDKEDPAYTIMRRAIAKAKYHSMQVDEYNAMVYVKGSGRLLKTPWLFRKRINKALAEEGIDSTVAFTQESISKLHYTRPDQYRDTVVSIRTVGSDNNSSPMGFIYSSFYEPSVVNGVSPLAPDAFAHYRFEYLGYINDGDQVINKIKVIPRGKGDQVYEGVIYIVDNAWSIYSLDLATYVWGIRFDLQQRFEQLMPDVWLPVHEIYDVGGSVFGFAFEYRYFAQLSDYKIKLNPDLEVPVLVLDPKKEKEEAEAADAQLENKSYKNGLSDLDRNAEISTKQLRKMMKEYEEQEIEALPENDTIQFSNVSTQVIDSTAYKKDSLYWSEVRPMPLTDYEVKGYARQDSIAKVPPAQRDHEEDKNSQDTLNLELSEEGFEADVKRRTKFQLSQLISGGRYAMGENNYLKLKAPLQTINYNTVDGFHAGYEIEFGSDRKDRLHWAFGPSIRYNFSREVINYDGKLKLAGEDWSLRLSGGKQPEQFSYNHPISPWANSMYTLFANRNYLKEYEQQFIKIAYEQKFSAAAGIELTGEYADRKHLDNTTDIVFFDSKKLLYTSNDPVHIEGLTNDLSDHTAIISEFTFWTKPFWNYIVQRGTKRKDYSQSPVLTLNYRKGWKDEYDPFDLVEAKFEYRWPIGAGSVWSMHVAAGKFIGDNKPRYFADYAHFPGSRLINTPINPVRSFRMLDYYLYSTNDEYAYGLFNYQFRRFALTQINYFRRTGIRENIILNTLLTPNSNQYAELGYGINYIFRIARIEFVTSWQDFKYQDFAVRFGIATDFKSILGGF